MNFTVLFYPLYTYVVSYFVPRFDILELQQLNVTGLYVYYPPPVNEFDYIEYENDYIGNDDDDYRLRETALK